jgi:uncharacterized SAM-binding protein YcdF (DUF218 family)
VKDFSFDLGAVLLLMLCLQLVFRKEFGRLRRLLFLLPVVLLLLTAMRGMPEFWAKPLFRHGAQLPIDVCQESLSALVVLGGGLAGPDDLAISTQSRVRAAARWLATLPVEQQSRLKIILSAGPTLEGSRRPESVLMKEAFFAWRPKSQADMVMSEEQSLNTHDNATRVAALLNESGQGQAIALVTSGLHMPRSFATFQAVGFRICPVASPSVELSSEGFVNFRNGDRTVRVFNEYAGLLGYQLMGWLTPKVKK